jgi:hypothetical protein
VNLVLIGCDLRSRRRTALEDEPHVNPNTRMMEFSLRDPDGYCVMISAS